MTGTSLAETMPSGHSRKSRTDLGQSRAPGTRWFYQSAAVRGGSDDELHSIMIVMPVHGGLAEALTRGFWSQ